jgi:hypothetical protein
MAVLLWPMYFIRVGETFGLGPDYRWRERAESMTKLPSGWRMQWTA